MAEHDPWGADVLAKRLGVLSAHRERVRARGQANEAQQAPNLGMGESAAKVPDGGTTGVAACRGDLLRRCVRSVSAIIA